MAVITYQCDVCDRIIDIPQNKKGLEVMQRCIITGGCRGKLSQLDVKPDHIRGNFPERVDDLNDFVKRQTLYNHKQSVKLSQWEIVHNLGIVPSIQVFVERPKDVNLNEVDISVIDPNSLIELVELVPDSIEIIDGNRIRLNFLQPEKGVAQLVAKSTKPQEIESQDVAADEIVVVGLSNDSELTIATKNSDSIIRIGLTFKTPDGVFFQREHLVDNVSIRSAWVDYDEVLISGTKYIVRSFNFVDNDPIFGSDIPNGSAMFVHGISSDLTLGNPLTSLKRREVLGLLTNYPYQVQDKNVEQYFDFQSVTISNVNSQTIYDENDLLIEINSLSSVFPAILRI